MNNQTDLVPVTPAPLERSAPTRITGINLQALMEKAIDAKSAVEVIKELRVMEREDQARNAKALFDQAMNAFQAECPIILKTVGVKTDSGAEAYKFAPIEQIEVVIRPYCQKHGFSHKFPKMILGDGQITAFCEVKHDAGHSELTEVTYRTGAKTRMMSDTQVDAATETFAKRRALSNAYGLVIAGEDKDGGQPKSRPMGPSSAEPPDVALKALAKELWILLKAVRGTQPNWNEANKWMWKEEVVDPAQDNQAPNLTAEQFKQAIEKAKAKLK